MFILRLVRARWRFRPRDRAAARCTYKYIYLVYTWYTAQCDRQVVFVCTGSGEKRYNVQEETCSTRVHVSLYIFCSACASFFGFTANVSVGQLTGHDGFFPGRFHLQNNAVPRKTYTPCREILSLIVESLRPSPGVLGLHCGFKSQMTQLKKKTKSCNAIT